MKKINFPGCTSAPTGNSAAMTAKTTNNAVSNDEPSARAGTCNLNFNVESAVAYC